MAKHQMTAAEAAAAQDAKKGAQDQKPPQGKHAK